MNTPTIQDWLWVQAMFIQAMIGAISSNFRQVALSFRNSHWVLIVTLEIEDSEDREEIYEIVDEFSIFLEDIRDKLSSVAYVKAESVIDVSSANLKPIESNNTKILFRRRDTL